MTEFEFELAIGFDPPPAKMVKLMAMYKPSTKAVEKLHEGCQIIVLGPPIEAAAYGLSIANQFGRAKEKECPAIAYLDANHFMKMRREDASFHRSYEGSFDDALTGVDVLVWGFLSFVSQNVAHEIDAAINARLNSDKMNIITGWNQPTDSIKLTQEVRNDMEQGYPLLGTYATNPMFSYIVSVDGAARG